MKRRAILLSITTIAIFLAVIIFQIQPAKLNRTPPNPNGYDDFVQAGKMLTGNTVYASDLSLEELRDYFKANHASIDLIQAGLKKQCAVAFNKNSPAGFTAHVNDIVAIKANAHLLRAAGALAERENRFDDAAKIYGDLIEYGCASGKDGVFIDKLVSRACEIMGMTGMTNVISKLADPIFLHKTIRKLEKLNAERESLEQMIASEKKWNRHQGLQIRDRIETFFSGQSRRIEKGFRKQMVELQLQSSQLTLLLAARLFELETGRPAKAFSDVVPKYLKSVPVDPSTGKEIPFSLDLTKHSNELLL
jgi:hypothetical protein